MVKGVDYTVEKKEEIRKLSPAGEVLTCYRVWATSKGGTRYHVEVAEAELETSDILLTKRAKDLDAI